MTLSEVTHAIDLGFQDEVGKLLNVLMLNVQSGDHGAQADFERGLTVCLRAHDLSVASAAKLLKS